MGRSWGQREQEGEEIQENHSAMCLEASGFMEMGLVLGLVLANRLAWPICALTQGPSWPCMHLSVKVASRVRASGRWAGHIMGWCLLLPFGPSQILPFVFSSGTGTYSLSGPPVVRQALASGYPRPRWVLSIRDSLPLTVCRHCAVFTCMISLYFLCSFDDKGCLLCWKRERSVGR